MAPSLVAAALVFMPMGDEAKAAFVSSAMCGMIAASLVGGFFADSFGRIRAIRLAGLVALVSTPFICAHQGMFALALAGRFAQGVGLGLFSVLLPLYIAETQTADSRGRSMAFYQFFNSLGGIMGSFLCLAVASWGLTPSLAWRVDILLVFPVLAAFFAGSYLGKAGSDPICPLVEAGSDPTCPLVEAGSDPMSHVGSDPTRPLVEAGSDPTSKVGSGPTRPLDKAGSGPISQVGSGPRQPKGDRNVKRALALAVAVLALTSATGVGAIMHYSVMMMSAAGLDGARANTADTVMRATGLFAALLSAAFIDRRGRGFVLKIGTAGAAAALFAAGCMFCGLKMGSVPASFASGVAVAALLCVFAAFFSFGPGVCVWVVAAELLPASVRAKGMSFSLLCNQAVTAAVSFAFLPVASRFGFAPLFFVFALASVVYFAIAVCLERKCHVQTAM